MANITSSSMSLITPDRPKNRYLGGGRSDPALRRVARLADGWFASFVTPQEFAEGKRKLRHLQWHMAGKMMRSKPGAFSFAMSTPMGRKPGEILRPSSLATHAVHLS